MKGLIPKLGEALCLGFDAAKENSPTILTALAVGGVILTGVLVAKAMPKALRDVENERQYRVFKAEEKADKVSEKFDADYKKAYDEAYVEITKKDIFRLTWKRFIPPIVAGILTISAICGAQHINAVRQAAMAASYELLRNSFDDYREHVREELGKKRLEDMEHEMHKSKVDEILANRPLTDKELDRLDVEAGAALFVDGRVTGHRFISTYEKVYRAVDDVNEMLSYDSGGGGYDFVSIPTFLEMAGDMDNDFALGCEQLGFMALPFEKRLDRKSICEPVVGEHRGHTCTLVYLNYGEPDDKVFTR